MDYETLILETQENMDKALKHTLHEFANIHTGKATPAMLENIPVYVESYGTTMPIREMAAVSTPDSRTIQVQPWDRNTLKPIEKAIQTAGLGLNPVVRGSALIVPVPELSGDRRKELVKVASGYAEEGRVSIRKVRQQAMDILKKMKADGHSSEDDIKRYEKEVQSETDSHIEKIGAALKSKEAELLQV